MSIENKVFMISDGTGQLGQVVCRHFLEKCAKISTNYQSKEKLNQVFSNIPQNLQGNLYSLNVNITTEDGTKKWFKKTIDQLNQVDGVLHTLGGIHPKIPIAEMSFETWNQSINLHSSFILSKTVFPYFIEHKKGKLIFISALAGLQVEAKKGAYSAAKAGLIRLTETISEETKDYNIQTML